MKTLQPTEYMYASARIRALENRLVGRERMEVLIDARSADEVMDRLAEYGVALPETEGGAPAATAGDRREEMLLAVLSEAYAEVTAAVPDPTVFAYFRYPYDCNNLKVAVKCAVRGIPTDGLLFDFGTVPASDVDRAMTDGRLDAFPPSMAAAVSRAKDAYENTRDPRQIDVVLDAACYEDMLREATASGDATLISWLRAKIDLVNVLTCLRLLRMDMGVWGEGFLSDSILPGGTLDVSFFTEAYALGEGRFWDALFSTPYYHLRRVEGEPRPLYAVEKAVDDLYVELVRQGARVPFGAPVIGGYLVGCETSVRNIRMILAAKDAGLEPSVIRERIRVSYV